MRTFRSLVVLRRPKHELWTIMRDHLADFAADVADIRQIRQIERTADADGTVYTVNEWYTHQQIPATIRSMLNIDEVGWIDRNTWDAAAGTCSWTIEPHCFADYIACSGETTFIETMAGRGTRLALAGELDLKPDLLGLLENVEPMASGLVESIVAAIIPRNLRAVAEAAAMYELPC